MSDNDVRVFKYVVMGVVAIVTLFVGSCQTTNYQIARMVEAGAHPYVAGCVIDGNVGCSGLTMVEIEKIRRDQ